MNHELAKILSTALVQFIDEQRPEGTMCCSNAECESIEQMFEGGCYDIVEKFIQKKLTGLTEFEKCMLDFAKARDEYKYDSTKVVELNDKVIELTKSYSEKLLELAKKELSRRNEVITLGTLERTFECNPDKLPGWLKDKLGRKHLEGYIKGRNDALHEMSDFTESHFNGEKAKEGTYYKDYERNPEPVPTGIGVVYKSPNNWNDVTIVPNIQI